VEREKSWEKRNVCTLDLKTVITIADGFCNEFQTTGAERMKARFAKVVVVYG